MFDEVKFNGACESANIKSLIDKLPEGAETHIGKEIDPEGIVLSGGEGQRDCNRSPERTNNEDKL